MSGYCPFCGNEIKNSEDEKCNQCNRIINWQYIKKVKYCPICGMKQKWSSNNQCPKCGNFLDFNNEFKFFDYSPYIESAFMKIVLGLMGFVICVLILSNVLKLIPKELSKIGDFYICSFFYLLFLFFALFEIKKLNKEE